MIVSMLIALAVSRTPPDTASTLTSGCTGGITGGGAGVSVTSTGAVVRWTQTTFDRKTRVLQPVRTDALAAERLFARVRTLKFLSIAHNEPSNVTCFLALEGNQAHTVAWPMNQRPRRIAAVLALAQDVDRLAPAKR